MAGISREHLSRIESGKVAVTEEMKVKLLEALEKFNPEAPLTMLFDYVRIRFPTLDIGHIIKDILQLNIQYMIHEDFGHYSYTEHYYIGDIFVYTSPDEEKGVLLELKGKGCRQFESYLLAQERSWYDFLMDALVDGGVMKRLDLAINDHTGMLDIPELTEKCRNEECVSVFRSLTLNGRHFLLSTVMYALWIRKQTRNGATGNYLSAGRGSSGKTESR